MLTNQKRPSNQNHKVPLDMDFRGINGKFSDTVNNDNHRHNSSTTPHYRRFELPYELTLKKSDQLSPLDRIPPEGNSFLKAYGQFSISNTLRKRWKNHNKLTPTFNRLSLMLNVLDATLKECQEVTKNDINVLRLQCSHSNYVESQDFYLEVHKQLKAAERYLKRLEFHLFRLDEIQEQYDSCVSNFTYEKGMDANAIDGTLSRRMLQRWKKLVSNKTLPIDRTEADNYHHQHYYGFHYDSPSSSATAHRQILNNGGTFAQEGDNERTLVQLETDVESLLGTFSIHIKELVGFARLANGDVFEICVKCGPQQKWKSRCKIGHNRKQSWDTVTCTLQCLFDELLIIKVYEVHTFTRSVVLCEKSFDFVELISATPQTMILEVNRNGSLKLEFSYIWNPLDGSSLKSDNKSRSSSISKKVEFTLPRKKPSHSESRKGDDERYNALDTHESEILPTARRQSSHTSGRPIKNDNMLTFTLTVTFKRLQYMTKCHPELNKLHQVLTRCHAILSESKQQNDSSSSIQVQEALNSFEFLSIDDDDLDSTSNGKQRHRSSSFTPKNVTRSKKSNQPAAVFDKENSFYSYDGNVTTTNQKNLYNYNGKSPIIVDNAFIFTTNFPDLDVIFCHHLQRCEEMVEKLDSLDDFHEYSRRKIFDQLQVETVIIDELSKICRKSVLPDVASILTNLNAHAEVKDFWMSAVSHSSDGGSGFYSSSANVKRVLQRLYTHFVHSRYGNISEEIFGAIMRSADSDCKRSSSMLSVYQFTFMLHGQSLVQFIDCLAKQAWIIKNLESKQISTVVQTVQNLLKIPTLPSVKCFETVAALLCAENINIRAILEKFVAEKSSSFKNDLISIFTILLEHDHWAIRGGACRALYILKAKRSINALIYINENDSSETVRKEARKTLTFLYGGIQLPQVPTITTNNKETSLTDENYSGQFFCVDSPDQYSNV